MDSIEALRALIETGIDHHLSGNLQSALECYSAALDIEPTNLLVLYNIGCLFEEAGYLAESAEMFSAVDKLEALYADPDVLEARKNFGRKGIN